MSFSYNVLYISSTAEVENALKRLILNVTILRILKKKTALNALNLKHYLMYRHVNSVVTGQDYFLSNCSKY